MLLSGGALVVALSLWALVLLWRTAPLPALEVTGGEVYVDGVVAGKFRDGHVAVICVVVEVSGRWRVLRSQDTECRRWVGTVAPVPAEVQVFADSTCATVDVLLPLGERVRSAHPCDILVYQRPDPARGVAL